MKSEFAPNHITLDGIEMSCNWTISSTGRTVYCTYELDGIKFRIAIFGQYGELFSAAVAAAKHGDTIEVDGEGLSIILADAREVKERTIKTDVKPKTDVPEKWFIGQELTGKNWKILFDGNAGKTRVIFPRKPSQSAIDTVKAAGFYWSPTSKSWNKKLTFKAFKAAQELHKQLYAVIA